MAGERFELVDRNAAAEVIGRMNEDDLRFLTPVAPGDIAPRRGSPDWLDTSQQ